MRALVPAPRRQRTRHRAMRPRDGRGIAKGDELTHITVAQTSHCPREATLLPALAPVPLPARRR